MSQDSSLFTNAGAREITTNTTCFPRYLPIFSILSHIAIPVLRDAKLLLPSNGSNRWPVIVFSHGLGGSKNAYSHIAGSLSSHGVVVIAPDHRDGSAPISFVQNLDGTISKAVEYRSIPHVYSPEAEDGRDGQLRVRLWELGLVHEALLKVDQGEFLTNISAQHTDSTQGNLSMFASTLDVHTPGRISWSGHSFGATTVVQFIKSVFYRDSASAPSSYKPLFTASEISPISQQIIPSSPISLLDLWSPPLRSSKTAWLWDKPLPCYSATGAGGSNLLTILSETFFKWRANLDLTKTVIFPSKDADTPSQKFATPHVFYRMASAHLSQSDFALLSPWLTKRIFKADEPVITLSLNVRAILEVMRQDGINLALSSLLETEEQEGAKDSRPGNHPGDDNLSKGQDIKILATDGSVKGWVALKAEAYKNEIGEAANTKTSENANPAAAVIDGELMKTEKLAGKL